MLAVVAAIVVVILLTDRSTPGRVAGWIDDTSCERATRHRLHGAHRVDRGVEPALASRADVVELITCEFAGGSLEYFGFSSEADLRAAITEHPTTHHTCIHGREALVSAGFFAPELLITYCDRLGGRIVGSPPKRASPGGPRGARVTKLLPHAW